jgi:AcrR family transcriptional regulator
VRRGGGEADDEAGPDGDETVPWWPHRPARQAAPRDPVTEERIVETALRLLAEEGIDGVSVRRISTVLGVSRATVYWWIGSRERLIALVSDEVYAQVAIPAAGDARPWPARLRELAARSRAVYERYPGIVPLVQRRGALAGPRTLRLVDRYLSLLLEAGLSPHEAVYAFETISNALLIGLMDQPNHERDAAWTAGESLEALPADAFPGLHATAAVLQKEPTRNVDFTIDVIVAGLEHIAGQRAATPKVKASRRPR